MSAAPKRKDYQIEQDYIDYSNRKNKKKKIIRQKSVARARLIFVGAILLCFAFGLYYTSLSAAISNKSYELERLQGEIEQLKVANERLEYNIASMYSLDNVEYIASNELKMNKADDEQIVFVSLPYAEGEGESFQVAEEEEKDDGRFDFGSLFMTRALSEFVNEIFNDQSEVSAL